MSDLTEALTAALEHIRTTPLQPQRWLMHPTAWRLVEAEMQPGESFEQAAWRLAIEGRIRLIPE